MIDIILEKFTDITNKFLTKQALNEGAEKKDMALVFKLDSETEVEYLVLKNYNKLKSVSFLEVLQVRIDFKGYSLFVPKFIKGALMRFAEQEKIDTLNVRVILTFNPANEMNMWLYDNSKPIKKVELESFFETQDIL